MPKEEEIEIEGVITLSPKNFFMVECEHGEVSKHNIRLTVGDKVIVTLGSYDLYSGRITKRL